jgi:hypothetical protein
VNDEVGACQALITQWRQGWPPLWEVSIGDDRDPHRPIVPRGLCTRLS